MNWYILISLIIFCFLTSFILVKIIIKIDFVFGFYSISTARDIHKGKIPTLGGISFFIPFLISLIVLEFIYNFPYPTLYIISISFIAIFIGLMDDIWGLSPVLKFTFIIILIALMINFDIYAKNFIYPAGYILELGYVGIVFSIILIFIIINSFNFLDGMDGLASGVSIIILLGLSIINIGQEKYWLIFINFILISGLIGFLKYNYHPAKIFMGDTGSLFLGTIISFLLFQTFTSEKSLKIFPLLAFVLVPAGDFFLSIMRRLHTGVNPVQPDREHIHHRLLELGLSYKQTVWFLYLLTFLSVLVGIYVFQFHNSLSILFTSILFLTLILIIIRMGYFNIYNHTIIVLPEKNNIETISYPIPLNLKSLMHKILLFLGDLFSFNMALYLFVRYKNSLNGFHGTNIKISPEIAILLSMFWVLVFLLTNLYSLPWDLSIFFKINKVIKSIFIGLVLIGIFTFDRNKGLTVSQIQSLVIYGVLMISLVSLTRLFIIYLEGRFKILEYSYKNTLIIGSNNYAKKLIKDFISNPSLLNVVKGVIPLKKFNRSTFSKVPVLGDLENLKDIIKEYKIDEIILTEVPTNAFIMNKLLAMCSGTNVVLKTIPENREFFWSTRVTQLSGHQLIRIFNLPIMNWQVVLKRLIDLIIGIVLILLFFPLYLSIMFHLKRKKVPIFTKKQVLGLKGEPLILRYFNLSINRPSIVNRLLRNLPNLVFLINGKISLVGVEPEEMEWYCKNEDKISYIYQRLLVKPGLLSLAKVFQRSYLSQKDDKEKLRYDMYYIHNFSLALDFRIIIRSILLFFQEL